MIGPGQIWPPNRQSHSTFLASCTYQEFRLSEFSASFYLQSIRRSPLAILLLDYRLAGMLLYSVAARFDPPFSFGATGNLSAIASIPGSWHRSDVHCFFSNFEPLAPRAQPWFYCFAKSVFRRLTLNYRNHLFGSYTSQCVYFPPLIFNFPLICGLEYLMRLGVLKPGHPLVPLITQSGYPFHLSSSVIGTFSLLRSKIRCTGLVKSDFFAVPPISVAPGRQCSLLIQTFPS